MIRQNHKILVALLFTELLTIDTILLKANQLYTQVIS